jgi:hypothetical protein
MGRCCKKWRSFFRQQTIDNGGEAGTPNRREVKLLFFKNMKVFMPQNVMK